MNRFVASRLLRCNISMAFRGVQPARRRLASSLVSGFDASIAALPMREAVRYKEKNIKWTSSDFQVSQLASCFLLPPPPWTCLIIAVSLRLAR